MSLTVIILTKNEGKNIEACLASVNFADEKIVIDDYSEDRTVKIAKKFGAKVYQRALNRNFGAQRNYGLSLAKNRWVLFLDADERVSEELKNEMVNKINNSENPTVGYFIKRNDFLFGKRIRFSESSGLVYLRLARKSAGKWIREVHEKWLVSGRTETLKNPLFHYPHQTIKEFLDDINFYTSIDAVSKRKEGKKSDLKKIIFWPIGKFVYNWIFRLGFLDKMEGFLIALLMSFHSFLSWSKLWLLQRNKK